MPLRKKELFPNVFFFVLNKFPKVSTATKPGPGGGGVMAFVGGALRKELFLNVFFFVLKKFPKVSTATKPGRGGGDVMAFVAGPLRKELFGGFPR